MKKRRNRLYKYSVILIFILTGCSGNVIYYDPSTKEIKTKEGNSITFLHIENNKDGGYYSFHSKDYSKTKSSFNLYHPEKNFKVYTSLIDTIPIDSFIIKPNRIYVIRNSSVGDAAYNEVEITTDSLCNVIKVK